MTELNDQARARFRELTARRDKQRGASVPLREARDAALDALNRQAEDIRAEYAPQIAEAEDGLFEIDQEIARLARFLDGKTGPVGTEADLKAEA
jgi:hypothetical protein